MRLPILLALCLVPIGLTSQTTTTGHSTTNFILTLNTPGLGSMWGLGDAATRSTKCTSELVAGKLHLRWESHEACYAATLPGCAGHDKTWIDVYAASNGVVVLERRIEPRWVQRVVTNTTTVTEMEWPP